MKVSIRRMIEIGLKVLKSEKGAALVLVALLMPILMGFCALVIDIGRVAWEKQKLQNAIDAACLAGARELPYTGAATTTACTYISSNDYNADSDISSPTFSNALYTINISGCKTVEYTFAKVLGLNSITIYPSAAATKERGPLDYAVFSGNDTKKLDLPGEMKVEGGMVHSNDKINFLGTGQSIPYGCEAVKDYNGTTITKAKHVDMPDYSSLIKTDTIQTIPNSEIVGGTWTYDGRSINGGIYVNGDLVIKSGDITGIGTIIAKGDITYIGSGAYATADSSVCLYSQTGDIILNGTDAVFYGTLYAPSGDIRANGGATVYGRLVADTITLNGKVEVYCNPNDLLAIPNLPELPVTLTR